MNDLLSELHDLRTRLDATNQRLAAAEQELVRTGRAHRPRRRWRSARARLGAAAALAVLFALVPLSLFAANPFNDLVPGSVHNANIDAIYNAGITTGCVPNVSYCPTANVTRQEMASFLARTAGIGANKPVTNAARLAVGSPVAGGPTYAANDLVRVARAGTDTTGLLHSITGTQPSAFQDVLTLTISAPGAGFVLVNASVSIENGGACTGFGCGVFARLQHGNSGAISPYLVVDADTGNHPDDAVALTYIFPVSAGVQTFTIQLGRNNAAATMSYFSPQATALFVPFGSTGASTLGTDAPAAPGSGHGGQP